MYIECLCLVCLVFYVYSKFVFDVFCVFGMCVCLLVCLFDCL